MQVIWVYTGTISRDPAQEAYAADFPVVEYETAFQSLVAEHLLPEATVATHFDANGIWVGGADLDGGDARVGPPELTQIIAGMGAVPRRHLIAAKADDEFRSGIASVRNDGLIGWNAARLLDEPFFVFHSAILAAVESLAYALAWLPYRAGKQATPPRPERVDLPSTADAYRVFASRERLTEVLSEIARSEDLKKVRRVRNLLEHRGAAALGAPDPGSNDVGSLHTEPYLDFDLRVNEVLCRQARELLTEGIRRVLAEVPGFVQRHPPRADR